MGMEYSEGLKKNEDFRKVYKEGRSKSNSVFVLYVLENGTDRNRLGVVISKKTGNSVVRHRIKRLVKENYRLSEKNYKKGYDLVFVARSEAAEADFYKVGEAMARLRAKQGIDNETA